MASAPPSGRFTLRRRLPSPQPFSSAEQWLVALPLRVPQPAAHSSSAGLTPRPARPKLADWHGTALSLSAPRNKAPLAVSREVMVKNLNAQFVGGLSASSVKFTGGDGIAPPNSDVALNHSTNVPVAGTGPLPAGIYYVTATALIDLTVGDFAGQCSIFRNGAFAGVVGGGDGTNFVQAAETLTIQLKRADTLQEDCSASGTGDGSEAIDGSIVAIRILASSGAKPVP